jgi:hypothetical protein
MQTTHRKNLESNKQTKAKLPILTFESGPKKKLGKRDAKNTAKNQGQTGEGVVETLIKAKSRSNSRSSQTKAKAGSKYDLNLSRTFSAISEASIESN